MSGSGVKFNGAAVVDFATGTSVIDKQGTLLKRGGGSQSTRSRYFVLRGNLLFYFKTQKEFEQRKEPIGFILLENYDFEYEKGDDTRGGKFMCVFGGIRVGWVFPRDARQPLDAPFLVPLSLTSSYCHCLYISPPLH